MKYYFAPLEGITGHIYRQAHHKYYPGIDKYYIPFIVPKEKRILNTREYNDVLPEHNEGMRVVPQIMTNKAEDFLKVTEELYERYGYEEIDLNLGCPSKTVVSKKRGAGFLSVPDSLDLFLEAVVDGLEKYGVGLSIKTRIGKDDPEEFILLLDIFQKYPLSELIVHPRVQVDFYNGQPDLQAFSWAYERYAVSGDDEKTAVGADVRKPCSLCYNGDIFRLQDYQKIYDMFSGLGAVMMGRGLLQNPRLVEEIKVREKRCTSEKGQKEVDFVRFQTVEEEKEERERRYKMHSDLMDGYSSVLSGEKDVLFKMKELWLYMGQDFVDPAKYLKKIKKAQKLSELDLAVHALCEDRHLLG